jgi:broad specificity phosphatase PhoE
MNDPKNERIRGYSDVPLSYEGKLAAEATGEFLAKTKMNICHVISSPLQRAIMTSNLVTQGDALVKPDKRLLPWNLGKLMGEPVKAVAPKMDFLQEYPDLTAPEGESYREFYDRWTRGLDAMMAYAIDHSDEVLVGVVHSRNLLAMPSILGDRNIGDVPVKGGPSPASVVQLTYVKGTWHKKLIWPGAKS